MLSQLTYKQFIEWSVFTELEPWGEEREDVRNAAVTAMLLNVNRNPKKKREPFELRDTLLIFGDSPRPAKRDKSWQEMKAVGKMIAASYNVAEKKASKRRARGGNS